MENKANSNITEQDLKELERNYKRMWVYLASAIYYRGGTHGHAEQKALEQMDTFVQIKTSRDNPMNEALKKINSEYRKAISENIMTNEQSNHVFSGNELVRERWAAGADREYKLAMQKFNEFYDRYQSQQNNNKSDITAKTQQLSAMLIQMVAKNQGRQ